MNNTYNNPDSNPEASLTVALGNVADNLRKVQANIPQGVQLVAISKFHPNEYIQAAYDAGQRVFGESHEQELAKKVTSLPKDIKWHFIGHLQTNKVKYIAPYISMIEAVDSLKLLKEINKQAAKNDRVINVLLELHIAEEETKYGLTLDACRELLKAGEWREMKNVQICGLMMMASNVDNEAQIRKEMTTAADFFDEVKASYFPDDPHFCERSWGMSHDYKIAVQCRSTMVRVGTAIFGPRVY
ncbi:YggS family pyridoxal phosphate-dependent enzyme [uncultured Prevotella sp.]|uniref:YggS family pyridoxal phosphate-dependent enzyme n=1 Tax=uncultured Prevotella sp. TaxID=159272 RepID=UPI002598F2F4|nr:YggS family pyridoxal phosphate-dependent enzyme [uncultured Prevotella sp.]